MSAGTTWPRRNLVETRFGRVNGASTAGAQGPMQFLPSTFAAYGNGGDIHVRATLSWPPGATWLPTVLSVTPDHALYRYNHPITTCAPSATTRAVLAADRAAFAYYYEWEVYCKTTAGDVLLPVGYAETAPVSPPNTLPPIRSSRCQSSPSSSRSVAQFDDHPRGTRVECLVRADLCPARRRGTPGGSQRTMLGTPGLV